MFREEWVARSRREYSGEVAKDQSRGAPLYRDAVFERRLGRAGVPECHFLRHLKKKLSEGFVGFAQEPAKLVEVTRFFTNAAPCNVTR